MPLQILRTSERSDYKTCPWMWYHGWVEGLTLSNPRPGAADFGSGLHLVLAEYYKPGKRRGKDPRKSWIEWMDGMHGQFVRIDDPTESEEEGLAKYEDARELGLIILDGYLETYGKDPDIEVIAPEQRFSIRIPHPNREIRRKIVRYVGTFDLIYRDLNTGFIYILDTKSTNKNLARFLLDTKWSGQFMGYSSVATEVLRAQGLIKPTDRVAGMTYNMIRRAKPDARPIGPDGLRHNTPQKKHFESALGHLVLDDPKFFTRNKIEDLQRFADERGIRVFGDVGAKQPGPLFMRETFRRTSVEDKRQTVRIGQEAVHMRKARLGSLPILKNPGDHCSWKCDFKELCEIDENGGDYDFYREQMYTEHDPYADHRIGAENSKTSIAARERTGVK